MRTVIYFTSGISDRWTNFTPSVLHFGIKIRLNRPLRLLDALDLAPCRSKRRSLG
jgi:hypothetical protein